MASCAFCHHCFEKADLTHVLYRAPCGIELGVQPGAGEQSGIGRAHILLPANRLEHGMTKARCLAICLAVFLYMPLTTGRALERLSFSVGVIQTDTWSAEGIVVETGILDGEAISLMVSAKELTLPAPINKVSNVLIRCEKAQRKGTLIECRSGTLRASNALLKTISGHVRFRYQYAEGALDFSFHNLSIGGVQLSLNGKARQSRWDLSVSAKDAQLQQLAELASKFGYELPYQSDGSINLLLRVSGHADRLMNADISADLSGLRFNNEAGTHAGEDLSLKYAARLEPARKGWKIDSDVTIKSGQLYIDPLFLEVTNEPVELAAMASWNSDAQTLAIETFDFQHPGAVHASGSLRLAVAEEAALQEFDITVLNSELSGLYGIYVKPWLLGTMGGDLEARGSLQGRARYSEGALQDMNITFASVSVSDELKRLHFDGLHGSIDWAAGEEVKSSDISWQSAKLFQVDVGTVQLPFTSSGSRIDLGKPVTIPILDGGLRINQWHVAKPGAPDMRWSFDGVLTPMSMEKLTTALNWPPLAGKLSGMVPSVTYDSGVLQVGGVLLARAFDGEITVRDLVLEQPFGVVPRLQASIAMKDIDLETLTRTFSFGKIEGRVGVQVSDLRMEQWRAVAFDATLKTVNSGKTRRRISQRALENISDIGGGGVGGVLSRSFLSMFKDFPYRQLGIACRLEHGVCYMDGVAPSNKGGYFLVQGSLIPPRVDVVGFSEQVDWRTLVDQLILTTSGEGDITIQ